MHITVQPTVAANRLIGVATLKAAGKILDVIFPILDIFGLFDLLRSSATSVDTVSKILPTVSFVAKHSPVGWAELVKPNAYYCSQ